MRDPPSSGETSGLTPFALGVGVLGMAAIGTLAFGNIGHHVIDVVTPLVAASGLLLTIRASRRDPGAAIELAAMMLGPIPVLAMFSGIARLDEELIANPRAINDSLACCTAPIFAAVGAGLALAARVAARAMVRRSRPALWVTIAAIALGGAAAATTTFSRERPPSARDQLDRMPVLLVIEPYEDSFLPAQRVMLSPDTEIARMRVDEGCRLEMRRGDAAHREVSPVDLSSCGPLSVGAVSRAWIIAPHDDVAVTRWTEGVGIDRRTLEMTHIGASDFDRPQPAQGAPATAGLVGLALALVALGLALRERHRARRAAALVEAVLDEDRRATLDHGAVAHVAAPLPAGPLVIDAIAPTHASYRDDGLPMITRARPGTRESWIARHEDATRALALASLAALLWTWIPIVMIWISYLGEVIVAPW